MKLNISSRNAKEIGADLLGEEPTRGKVRIPAKASYRFKQRWPRCPETGKLQLTERGAAAYLEAAKTFRSTNTAHMPRLRVKRKYVCQFCGDWHLTSQSHRTKR